MAHSQPPVQPLSLAGSNTVQHDPSIRIASTAEAWNQNLRHITLKRLADPHGERGNRIYQTDKKLMERLAALARDSVHPYPEPEGPGTGTNRVRVCLLSNDPNDVVILRREYRVAAPLQCTCNQWRQKTEAEATADGLVWPPDDFDREAYFISRPSDGEGFGCTWHTYKDEVVKTKDRKGNEFEFTKHILSKIETRVCNPHTCKFSQAGQRARCKPVVDINVRLGDWGGGELAFVHAESWATVRRIRTSLARVFELCGGRPAGVEVDLVLEYTKPQKVPGESGKKRQPYWVFDILYGMTETEFIEYAIARRQKVQADRALLAGLNEGTTALLEETQMPWRQGALLPEFRPEVRALTEGDGGLVGRLCREFGMTVQEAEAALAANAGDIEGFLGKLVPKAPDEEPEIAEETVAEVVPEVIVEPEKEAEAVPAGEFTEGEFEPAAPAEPIAESAPVPGPEPQVQPEPVVEAPPLPLAEPAAPMFETEPKTGFEIRDRFGEIDEMGVFGKLLPKAWKEATGSNRSSVPTLPTCKGDAAVFSAVLTALWMAAEDWWAQAGYAKHGGGSDD